MNRCENCGHIMVKRDDKFWCDSCKSNPAVGSDGKPEKQEHPMHLAGDAELEALRRGQAQAESAGISAVGGEGKAQEEGAAGFGGSGSSAQPGPGR